jgi:hypothetical protein
MANPTTLDLDTELSAVNSILGSIGQSPVTSLNFQNPEIEFIYNILTEVSKDVQNEGWQFNLEQNKPLFLGTGSTAYSATGYDSDDDGTGDAPGAKIDVADTTLAITIHEDTTSRKLKNTVIRYDGNDRRVYDVDTSQFFFAADATSAGKRYETDIVSFYTFNNIPNPFQRYITYRSAVRAATQLIANPQLVTLLQIQEMSAKANCLEYEGRQGDHSFFGLPNAKRLHSAILNRSGAAG